jgi:hypothetical protein
MKKLQDRILDDPPPTGRRGDVVLRPQHPNFAAPEGSDPRTVRLLYLVRTYPDVVAVREDEIASLEEATKVALLAQFDTALGIKRPNTEATNET